jgi:glycosyltransferase involved in cell wall biosynthesis
MSVPWGIRASVRRARNAAASAALVARQRPRWRAIAQTPLRRGEPAVSYGVDSMPTGSDVVFGGAVKLQLLDRRFPNAPRDFNVLYLASSAMPLDAGALAGLARRRGAVFVWNQDGVAYRGWYGDGWELVNRPRARLLHEADHVLYQSEFCKLAADRFYGERSGPSEVVYNPVDTHAFTPASERSKQPLTLLLGGNQYQRYRFECALETIALVRRERADARLLVAGALSFAADAEHVARGLIQRLRLDDAVELLGPYTQAQAPDVVRRADILLHTKYNDPCPTTVLEAMACGLPVVYSASGGTPELVGSDAGVGIDAPLDWERDRPPDPRELARAVVTVSRDLDTRSVAARERSLRFDAEAWLERHREIFEKLTQ